MKKLSVLFIVLFVLAFANVCGAAAKFDVKLGASNAITCTDGVLKFKATIYNHGTSPGTLTSIHVNEIRLYADESVWWIGRDRDLGSMAYYLQPGQSKVITVTIRDRNIKGYDGPKRIWWNRKIHWGNE